MDWQQLAYLAACLVVPAAWGAFSAWLFSRIDARRRGSARPAPVDYMI
jgi:hypothetical protein